MQNQTRIIIENVMPQLDGGVFAIKRVVGQAVQVTASVFSDGHDVIEACVKYKHESEKNWSEVRMAATYNDEWEAQFKVEKQGIYTYYIESWVDYALNWQHGTERKIQDNQYVKSELLEGAEYVQAILNQATEDEKGYLRHLEYLFTNESEYEGAIY
ncbi:MAG: hypothetical protein QG594_1626, partial [Bacteroidota bacterium]|nr:hypothetical protein [Bacteroidota bacterium]